MNEPISEAQAMYEYLVEYGIDSKRIKKEAQSTSTVENFQFSYKLIGNPKNSVGIVFIYKSHSVAAAIFGRATGCPARGEGVRL